MSTEEPTLERGRCLRAVVNLSRNYKFLTCICILTVLDASLVAVELVVDILENRSAAGSVKHEGQPNASTTDNGSVLIGAYSTAQDSGNSDDHHHVYGTIATVSRYGSIGILSIMVVWNVLRLGALRMLFFKSKLQVVDGGVVIISLVLDVVFLPELNTDLDKALVAVIGLTWRIVRVVNNSLVLLHEIDHIQVKSYMHQAKSSWKRCLLLKREVLNLRNLCRRNGVTESDINDSKTAARLHYMRHKNQSTTQSALIQSAALPVLYVLGEPASQLFYDNQEDEDDVNYKTSQMTVQCVHCTTIQRQMEEKRAQLPAEWRMKLTKSQAADMQRMGRSGTNDTQRLSKSPVVDAQRTLRSIATISNDGQKAAKPSQPAEGQRSDMQRVVWSGTNDTQRLSKSPVVDAHRTIRSITTISNDGQKATKPSQPAEGQRKGRFISVRTNPDATPRERDLGDGAESENGDEDMLTRL